jgi:hypothetical protein
MNTEHVSDHDLERYYVGMVTDEGELAKVVVTYAHLTAVGTTYATRRRGVNITASPRS